MIYDVQLSAEQIAQIVDRVLEVLGVPNPDRTQNGLVLFTGAMIGFEPALEALARLNGKLNLDYIQTPSAQRLLDQNKIAALGMTPGTRSFVASHDLLIVPTLTANLAAKVARGIGDDLASNVTAEFVMTGRKVVFATDAANPDAAAKRAWFPNMPAGYAAMLRSNLATLQSFGVQLTAAEQLDQAVLAAIGATGVQQPAVPAKPITSSLPAPSAPATATIFGSPVPTPGEPPQIVTATMVMAAPSGSVVRVGPKTMITDLAKERAQARQITFEMN